MNVFAKAFLLLDGRLHSNPDGLTHTPFFCRGAQIVQTIYIYILLLFFWLLFNQIHISKLFACSWISSSTLHYKTFIIDSVQGAILVTSHTAQHHWFLFCLHVYWQMKWPLQLNHDITKYCCQRGSLPHHCAPMKVTGSVVWAASNMTWIQSKDNPFYCVKSLNHIPKPCCNLE